MSAKRVSARPRLDFHRRWNYVTNLSSCQDEEICTAFTIDEITVTFGLGTTALALLYPRSQSFFPGAWLLKARS